MRTALRRRIQEAGETDRNQGRRPGDRRRAAGRGERDGKALKLTPKEYDLLLLPAPACPAAWSRTGRCAASVSGSRSLARICITCASSIGRLRGKVERDAANPRIILTATPHRLVGFNAGSTRSTDGIRRGRVTAQHQRRPGRTGIGFGAAAVPRVPGT